MAEGYMELTDIRKHFNFSHPMDLALYLTLLQTPPPPTFYQIYRFLHALVVPTIFGETIEGI